MAELSDLKNRIKSIKNTRQVTKAMEAVSASKMRKAVGLTLASRPYVSSLATAVGRIRGIESIRHPFLDERPIASTLGILLTSDRGLCGGLNTSVVRAFLTAIKERRSQGIAMTVMCAGKKGALQLRRAGIEVQALFEGRSDRPDSASVRPLAATSLKRFVEQEIDEVIVAYADFQSTLKQIPTVRRLLPFGSVNPTEGESEANGDVLFEPDPRTVLDRILPRLAEVYLYQCFLEAAACEHSGRMVAMRNATDNADGMIDELTLTYNQARQASITQEIAEIAAGRAALEI